MIFNLVMCMVAALLLMQPSGKLISYLKDNDAFSVPICAQ